MTGAAMRTRAQFVAILAAAEANQWDERLATANGDLGDLAAKAGDDAAARRYYEAGLAHAYRIKRANTIAPVQSGSQPHAASPGRDCEGVRPPS